MGSTSREGPIARRAEDRKKGFELWRCAEGGLGFTINISKSQLRAPRAVLGDSVMNVVLGISIEQVGGRVAVCEIQVSCVDRSESWLIVWVCNFGQYTLRQGMRERLSSS